MRNYNKIMEMELKHSKRFICGVCGNSTPVFGEAGICYNCESIISTNRNTLISHENELVGMLDSYNKKIMDKDYANAIKEYEVILGKYNIPAYFYMNGINYLKYSNYKMSQVRYDRNGFMDENSDYKKESIELFSHARLFFNKAIYVAKQSFAEGSEASYNALYIIFLSYMKLRDLKSGSYYLNKLKNLNAYISDYSEIIFTSSIENYDDVLEKADLMIEKNETPFTLFYYIAFALFKKRKYKNAQKLLEALQGIIPNSSIDALLEDIILL